MKHNFCAYVSSLELESLLNNKEIDIIGLTEILPKHSVFENLDIYYKLNNYNIYTNDLKEGRGIAIYVREGLCAEQVFMQTDFKEAVQRLQRHLRHNDSLLVCCMNRSPNSNDQNSNELISLFNKVKDTGGSHKLIMAHFNLKEINWENMTTSVGETHLASLFVECICDSYFVQHVTQPTRIRTGNKSSVLDLIFTNEEGMMLDLNLIYQA